MIQDKYRHSLSDKEKSQMILHLWQSKQKYPSLAVNTTDIEYNINSYGNVWNWTNDSIDGYWANSGNSARFDGYYLVPDLYHYYPYGMDYAGLNIIDPFRVYW